MSASYGTGANADFEPYEFGEFGGQSDEAEFLKGTGKGTAGFAGDLSSASVSIPVSGNMSSAGNGPTPTLDTLDEPVSTTILRDLRSIWGKLRQVLVPKQDSKNILRDWDLWGPLLLCLALSIRLSIMAPQAQKPQVFTAIFVIVWCGAAVVTLNSKLLGGTMYAFWNLANTVYAYRCELSDPLVSIAA
ncbi:hypothetical protein SpCBS45565_g02123 [Spizellomyces sp. 'palustris']|nr:hypothetical protein SpCBS45565_g02123 [Spizellomyces sp. 'palustris']